MRVIQALSRGLAAASLTAAAVVAAAPAASAAWVELYAWNANFGDVYLGDSPTQSITVLNSSFIGDVTISDVGVTDGDVSAFTVDRSCVGTTLSNTGDGYSHGCDIAVTFTPTETRAYSATLTISSDADNSPNSTTLTGTGVPAPVPPANDLISAATVITTLPFTDQVAMADATRSAGDLECGSISGTGTVWYQYTPAADTRISLSLGGAFANVALATGAPGALTMSECRDMWSLPLQTTLLAETTYYLQLSPSWQGLVGLTELTITQLPPPLQVSATPTKATVSSAGLVSVTIRVTCNRAVEQGQLDVQAQQSNRRFTANGGSAAPLTCQPASPTSIKVQFPAYTGTQFMPGRMSVTIGVFAYAWPDYLSFTQPTQTVIASGVR